MLVEPAQRCLEGGAELGIGESLLCFVPGPIERMLPLQLLSAEVVSTECHTATVTASSDGTSDGGDRCRKRR